MSVISIQPTFPLFAELDGTPLETGYIYIGTANLNPEINPATVYWDFAQTVPAAQPIRTIGGRPARNGVAARLYIEGDYSMTVRDKNSNLVYSAPSHPATAALESIVGLTSVAGTNTITATAAAPPSAYAAKQRWSLIVAVTNTGAVTINISGLGARAATKYGAIPLDEGDMPAGAVAIFEDDGTQLQLINVKVKNLSDAINTARATVASHATTSAIWAAAGNEIDFTGAATLTDLPAAPQPGASRLLHIAAACTFTDNANLDVDGGTFTASAGDVVIIHAITTTTFKVKIQKADGTATVGIAQGTEQASTSGTFIDFTGIPAGTKRIKIEFVGVSTNGSSNPTIQLGDSGGVEASGYLGAGTGLTDAGAVSVSNYTTGFGLNTGTAAAVMHGIITLALENAATFTWIASGIISRSDSAVILMTAGSKSLSAELDRVRITTSGGSNSFDAGAINIQYES